MSFADVKENRMASIDQQLSSNEQKLLLKIVLSSVPLLQLSFCVGDNICF